MCPGQGTLGALQVSAPRLKHHIFTGLIPPCHTPYYSKLIVW